MATPTFTPVDSETFMQEYGASMARKGPGSPKGWKPQQAPMGDPPARNVGRIMPPHPRMVSPVTGKPTPIIGVKLHFSLGPQQNTASPCLEPYGEECPACEWVDALFNRARAMDPAGAQQYKDIAYKQRATLKFSCNWVDLAKPELGVQPWYFYDEVEKGLRGCFLDDSVPPRFRDITHPETGRNVILMVGTKLGNNKKEYVDWHSFRAAESPSPLPDTDWLGDLLDLAEQVFQPTADQVRAALQGQRIQRDGTTTVFLPPTPAPAALPPARAAAVAAPAPPLTATVPPAAAGEGPRRGPGRPRVPAPASAIPMPAAPPVPSALSAPSAAQPARRQPMQAAAVAETNGDPWAQARALVIADGCAKPMETTTEDIELARTQRRLMPCFGWETDPKAVECQGCNAIIPCYGILKGIQGLPAPMAR